MNVVEWDSRVDRCYLAWSCQCLASRSSLHHYIHLLSASGTSVHLIFTVFSLCFENPILETSDMEHVHFRAIINLICLLERLPAQATLHHICVRIFLSWSQKRIGGFCTLTIQASSCSHCDERAHKPSTALLTSPRICSKYPCRGSGQGAWCSLLFFGIVLGSFKFAIFSWIWLEGVIHSYSDTNGQCHAY